jgi:hypothetical protein
MALNDDKLGTIGAVTIIPPPESDEVLALYDQLDRKENSSAPRRGEYQRSHAVPSSSETGGTPIHGADDESGGRPTAPASGEKKVGSSSPKLSTSDEDDEAFQIG